MKRAYIDVNGKARLLEFVENVGYLVSYHKDYEPSSAKRWKLEDGHIIQVPDNIWSKFNIEYVDLSDE